MIDQVNCRVPLTLKEKTMRCLFIIREMIMFKIGCALRLPTYREYWKSRPLDNEINIKKGNQ